VTAKTSTNTDVTVAAIARKGLAAALHALQQHVEINASLRHSFSDFDIVIQLGTAIGFGGPGGADAVAASICSFLRRAFRFAIINISCTGFIGSFPASTVAVVCRHLRPHEPAAQGWRH
jgi:hypothetical protein